MFLMSSRNPFCLICLLVIMLLKTQMWHVTPLPSLDIYFKLLLIKYCAKLASRGTQSKFSPCFLCLQYVILLYPTSFSPYLFSYVVIKVKCILQEVKLFPVFAFDFTIVYLCYEPGHFVVVSAFVLPASKKEIIPWFHVVATLQRIIQYSDFWVYWHACLRMALC